MTLRWEAFLDRVRERGEYETHGEAERAARVVLALLGAHLVGRDRAELAARLPETMALILLNPLQAVEPLSPERFVRATAGLDRGCRRTDGPVGRRSRPQRGGRGGGRGSHPAHPASAAARV
ncbi:uncharacterized protein DUF2267 [Streptomyces sp. HB202]|nr:uncharacterized protein DUF2267 [Streptomyces sp. HB202]